MEKTRTQPAALEHAAQTPSSLLPASGAVDIAWNLASFRIILFPKKPDGAPVLSSLPLSETLNPGTQGLTNVILLLSLNEVFKLVSQMPHLLSHFLSKVNLSSLLSLPRPYISA